MFATIGGVAETTARKRSTHAKRLMIYALVSVTTDEGQDARLSSGPRKVAGECVYSNRLELEGT